MSSLYDNEVLQPDSEYVQYVSEMLSKFPEFRHISSSDIIITINRKRKANEEKLVKGECNYATISKLSPKICDIFAQICNISYLYILELTASEIEALDSNQIKAILYFELSRIDEEYKISKLNENSWIKILHGIGRDFKRQDSTCTDILSTDFTWEKCLGSYFGQLKKND